MNTVIIAIGSNIDPEQNIEKALNLIRKNFTIRGESEFIQTKPVGYVKQADFINGSVMIETDISQSELKERLSNLEQQLGRTKSAVKFGPRTIDLDVIVWNNTVTHKDFYERDFVKNAVLKLIPELEH